MGFDMTRLTVDWLLKEREKLANAIAFNVAMSANMKRYNAIKLLMLDRKLAELGHIVYQSPTL